LTNAKAQISCIIIAGNEAENIGGCLESVTWCDEIIVVDSYSTDETARIAKGYTEKVFERKWEGYASQKRYAMGLAKHEWVLSLDADERISERLRQEIEAILRQPHILENGFYLSRRNFFLGYKLTQGNSYPDYQLRLFRKACTTMPERKVHEGFEVSGEAGRISAKDADILHHTAKSLSHYAEKQRTYTDLAAHENFHQKKYNGTTLAGAGLHAAAGFVQKYIFKLGFLDGLGGLFTAYFHARDRWLFYTAIRRLQRTHS
jgi:glycosyltransferase involved in cell wall biosynthesis